MEDLLKQANDLLFTVDTFEENEAIVTIITEIEKQIEKINHGNTKRI